MKSPNGFLEYGDNDAAWHGGINSVILSAQCTSAAEILAQGLTIPGSTPLYNSRGMHSVAGDDKTYIKINSATTSNTLYASRVNDLKNAGHITLWVEDSIVDVTSNPASTTMRMLGWGSAFYPELRISRNAANRNQWLNQLATNGALVSNESLYGTPISPNGFSRVDISWVNNMGATNYSMVADLYVNKVLVSRTTGSSAQANWDHTQLVFWAAYYGQNGIQYPGGLYRVQVSTRPIMLPQARSHLNFAAFGDSLTYNASLPTGDPYKNGSVHNGGYGSAGFIHGIRRVFAERDLMPYLLNYGVIGNQSSSFAAEITQCFTTENQRPKHAWVMFGANDATASVSDTTFDTNIRNGLNTLFNTYGLTKVFIGKPPTLAWLSGATQAYLNSITAYGVKIDAMKASYPNLVVVDAFNACGGHTDSSFFLKGDGTLDQHPNEKGNKAIQDLLNAALKNNLNWNG